MAHFAVLCPEVWGHFNPTTTLIAELKRRGHEVTWIVSPDGVDRVRERGVKWVTMGEDRIPLGTLDAKLAELGSLSGIPAVKCSIRIFREATEVILDEAPDLIRSCGASALIADEICFAARTISDMLEIPWITLCNALPLHPDPALSPVAPFLKHRTGPMARIRNRIAYRVGGTFLGPVHRVINKVRRHHGLGKYDFVYQNVSDLATIAQIPREFDYPRINQPKWFHYVGGLHNDQHRAAVEFPYERLDGRALVYASLGTQQNRVLAVYKAIAKACSDLPVQLVISMGGGVNAEDLGDLDGDPIVVKFAPQLELLKRARLVVTHAGLNTTIESIACGTPMLAIPITNDQPPIAARIAWKGCGEVVPFARANASRISKKLKSILEDDSYVENTRKLAQANRDAGGAEAAADIVERAIGANAQ